MRIAVDFDDTIAEGHLFPEVGDEVPGAISTLNWLQERGHRLVLFTLREDAPLAAAVRWLAHHGVAFNAIQQWDEFPECRKAHAELYIDDKGLGCPRRRHPKSGRKVADWAAIRKLLERTYKA